MGSTLLQHDSLLKGDHSGAYAPASGIAESAITNLVSDLVAKSTVAQVEAAVLTPFSAGSTVGNVGFDGSTPITITPGTAYDCYPGLCWYPTTKTLMVAYRSASGDGSSLHGIITGRKSTDLGRSWGSSFVVHQDAGSLDNRDAALTLLADGTTTVCSWFTSDNSSPSHDRSFIVRSLDQGVTWGSAISLNSGLTGWDAISGPVTDLGNGTLLAAVYGINTGDAKQSAVVVKSTDNGLTWGSPVTIANGVTDTRDYQEPNLLKLANGTIFAMIRTAQAGLYFTTSTDNGATWAAAAAAASPLTSGGGRPVINRLTSGALVCLCRNGTSQVVSTSWDNGATWSPFATLATAGSITTYAQMVEISTNLFAVAYGLAADATHSDIFFTYFFDRWGRTPFGWVSAEPKVRTLSIDVFLDTAHLNWLTYSLNTGMIHCGHVSSSNSTGVWRSWDVMLQKGTYTLSLMHGMNNTYGDITFYLNGTSVGTIVGYAASFTLNNIGTITFTITKSGHYTLKAQVDGNTSPSTGNIGSLQDIQLVRTDGGT